MKLGAFELPNRLFVAPMAGVTDRPFRTLCRRLGAGYAVSEMVTSRRELWTSLKTSRRADHAGEAGAPIAVQIAGVDPAEMADAARYNIDRGAQIIDINMGCPAKKVCNVFAGSALMSNEPLALAIVEAVVAACAPRGVPVTLKMRTGRREAERNAVALARARAGRRHRDAHRARPHARAGLQGPGRVRHDRRGEGRGGDPGGRQRRHRFAREGARGARAHACRRADDRPRGAGPALDLPRDRALPGHRRSTCRRPRWPTAAQWLHAHLHDHYALYGEVSGVRSARKHIGWALRALPGGEAFRAEMNRIDDCAAQVRAVADWFAELGARATSACPSAPPWRPTTT